MTDSRRTDHQMRIFFKHFVDRKTGEVETPEKINGIKI